MSEFLGWRAENSTAKNYVNIVKKITEDESMFNNFRAGFQDYTPILEHLDYNGGLIYANTIINEYPHLLEMVDAFRENDNVGSPRLYNYDKFGLINPTTLRYIKFAGDIQKSFGNLDGFNLVEIGGGYGGLVNVLSKLFKFNKISLYDLPEVLLLQKKYLNKFNINPVIDSDMDNLSDDNTITISNYSWCECDLDTRKMYLEKIIKKSKYTYMVVYDVDVDNELMTLDGEKGISIDTLNDAKIFTLKK
jgi:hypothetical protein